MSAQPSGHTPDAPLVAPERTGAVGIGATVDWGSFRDIPRRAPSPMRCDICGRRDETVAAIVWIRDYDPTAPPRVHMLDFSPRRCPKMCADCLEDEPSAESLARRVIG